MKRNQPRTQAAATPYAERVIWWRKVYRTWFSSKHFGVFATNSPVLYLTLSVVALGWFVAWALAEDKRLAPVRRLDTHNIECRRNECEFLLNAPEAEFLACVAPCIEARETRWKRLNNE